MKFCRTAISAVLSAAIILSMCIFAQADATQTESDKAYDRAVGLLSGLDIISGGDESEPSRAVTRGEFAGYLLDYMNIEYPESDTVTISSSPAADEWEWNTDSAGIQTTPTCFYDVWEEHPHWNKIKTAVEYGLMKGDGQGYFRPDEFVKNEELYTVLVESLGMKELAGGDYPNGYIRVAADKQLTKNVNNVQTDRAVTYRDMTVAIYNALFADVYEMSATGVITKSDTTFLTQTHKVYEGKGVVEGNGISMLDTQDKARTGHYKINGGEYVTNKDYTEYLGYRVVFYYDESGDDNNILYMYPDVMKKLVVNADDIIDYKKPYLSYTVGEKTKKEYLGAETSIIYNGKALLDYEESDLKIKEGTIEFIDNNNDGKYEVAVVESVEVLYIDGVDNQEKIVYATELAPKSISFDDADYFIYDAQGNARDFEAINKNTVLSVRRTLPTQGEAYINAVISSSVLVGKITGTNGEDDIVEVDSVPYETAYIFDGGNLKFNTEYTFSLTADGKIAYAEENTDLEYGYLIKVHADEMKSKYSAKIFSLKLNSVEKYSMGEKVVFNKRNAKASDVTEKNLMKDGKTETQLIRFSADENGVIKEILTAGANDELFCRTSIEFEGKTLKFRNNVNCFVDENGSGLPLFYSDSNTYYINIPRTDTENEDAYYLKACYIDNEYTFDDVYVENKDNAVVRVLVSKSDDKEGKTITKSSALNVVKKVTAAYVNGEENMCIEVMNGSGTKKYYLNDSERFEDAKKLKCGDLIKLSTAAKENGAVANFNVIFDGTNRMMNEGKNPHNASSSFISQSYIMHGKVAKRTGDDYLVIAPYQYSTVNDVVTKGDISQNAANFLTMPVKSATVYLVDGNNIRIVGADENIMDAATAGEGSEIVAYTSWENPKLIIIYK